jgi:prepilin-type N-terminal cleavage/methylation domain-containing protein
MKWERVRGQRRSGWRRRRGLVSGYGARAGGFSLIEILVAVAVIAVIAGVAVAALVPMTSTSQRIVARKNAQTIAETAANAQAIDPDYLATAVDLDSAVAITLGGFTAAPGSNLEPLHLGLLTLDAEQQAAAKEFLSFNAGRLSFDGNP